MARALGFLTLALLGCAPDGAREALVWARGDDSSTLDPAEAEWGEDIKVVRSLYETLVSFKEESFEIEGRLATGWSFSPDRKRLTFELRPGVRFHDGTPLDAEAVVFSFRRVLEPGPRSVPHARNFADVERVEAAGPAAVVFTLRRPSAIILHQFTHFVGGVVSPAAVRKHGARFGLNPCGTGPYRLARWTRDVRLELEAFPEYWGAPPGAPRLILVPVASPQTAVQKLRKGEVHVVDHPMFSDVRALEAGPATRVFRREAVNVCCLGFNMRRAPYNDVHFRRAVSLALDRRTLVELAYSGLAEPASNVVPPAVWREVGEAPPYEVDLEKAKASLARAAPASKEVELIHVSIPRPYMPEPRRVAEFVKDQLRKIGLEVRLTAYDKNAYALKSREEAHPMVLIGWHGDYPDPDNYFYPLLHGDNAGDLNQSAWRDAAFDDRVGRARAEANAAARRSLYLEAYSRYREEVPTIPLAHVPQVVAAARDVQFRMHPMEVRLYAARFRP